jgi:hypothetical protein
MPPRTELDEHVDEIRALGRRSFEDVVEIGRRLVRCRELLKTQRGWLAWIKTKFGWSRATADNMIAVYVHRNELLKFSTLRLPISALYLLAKQEPEVLQRIERRVDAGEPVTARAVKVIVTHVDRVIRSVSYASTPPEVLGPRPSEARIAADRFVTRLTSLAQVVPGLDVAEVAAAVEHYEGADMATRVMVDFLQELDRRLGERAPLELLASDSDTQH